MFYSLPLDELSEFTGHSIEELKGKSYLTLETMVDEMRKKKAKMEEIRNRCDENYARIIRTYLKPYEYLRQWFTDEEIIYACAATNVSIKDLTETMNVEPGSKCWRTPNEYLGENWCYVHKKDPWGREYTETENKRMDQYRVPNQYQGIHHGKIILKLLYGKYPALRDFEFAAYSVDYNPDNYEIYPSLNNTGRKATDPSIYTPFAALMAGDVEAIKARNREYAKSYNYGDYVPEKVEERFVSEAGRWYLGTVGRIPEMAKENHSCLEDV